MIDILVGPIKLGVHVLHITEWSIQFASGKALFQHEIDYIKQDFNSHQAISYAGPKCV